MKAVVLRQSQLFCEEVPVPEPAAGQVLVRTKACGICGSDLHMMQHGKRMAEVGQRSGSSMRLDMDQDLVLGHEFCAEVLDYGPDTARTLATGSLVTSMPLLLHNDHLAAIGLSNDAMGGYSEYMLLQELLLKPVPDGVPAWAAAFTEPLAVGLHAVNAIDYSDNPLVLVVGCGPVGLAIISCLKVRGIGVVAADFSPERRALAERIGADEVLDPKQSGVYEHFERLLLPEGYEKGSLAAVMGMQGTPRPGVVFECVGRQGILNTLIEECPGDTRIVSVGACMESETFEPLVATVKELSVKFVLGYRPEEFDQCLALIAEAKVDAETLITRKVPLSDLPGAFTSLLTDPKEGKIITEPQS